MNKPFHIECRRWFQRTYGNTYHSVRIYCDGKEIAYVPFEYGYGDQCLQTAIDWLKKNNLIPADASYGTRYLREELHSTYDIVDVARKRDL